MESLEFTEGQMSFIRAAADCSDKPAAEIIESLVRDYCEKNDCTPIEVLVRTLKPWERKEIRKKIKDYAMGSELDVF